MQHLLLVFIGGGLGSLCRYALSRWITQVSFPYATFAANVLSCIVLGVVLGLSLKNSVGADARVLIVTGFCGGFSTFSTFTYETLDLLQKGDYLTAFSYILFSLLVCLICVYLGMRLVS